MLDFSCFQGPDQEQQKVEPHHTVVFGDGDGVKFENKVRDFSLCIEISGSQHFFIKFYTLEAENNSYLGFYSFV